MTAAKADPTLYHPIDLSQDALAKLLGLDALPPGYDHFWAAYCSKSLQFSKQQAADDPFLTSAQLDTLILEGYLPAEIKPDLLTCLNQIAQNQPLYHALRFLADTLQNVQKPWENRLYAQPVPPSLGLFGHTFGLLLLVWILRENLLLAKARNIPQLMLDQLKGLIGEAASGGRHTDEPYGIRQLFHWQISCAFCTMFYIGCLRFELSAMPPEYAMYTCLENGSRQMVYLAQAAVDADGQFPADQNRSIFTTSVLQTDHSLTVNPIDPAGFVQQEKVTLSFDHWQPCLLPGQLMLSFHIPPKIDYTWPKLRLAMKQALLFYKLYFQEFDIRGVYSYSWLYSPQLAHILPPESRIATVNRQLYLAPVPSDASGFETFVFGGTPLESIAGTQKEQSLTSLQRRLLRFYQQGNELHNGLCFIYKQDLG